MEKKRKESGWMKYFKIPEKKIKIWSSIKICRFSLDVCRQVFLYAFSRLPKNSAEYLFQNKRPRLSDTQENNWLRFWSLLRKPKAKSSVFKSLAICLRYNTMLSYVIFQSNLFLFRSHFYFVSIFGVYISNC